jgi:hypothetical protein
MSDKNCFETLESYSLHKQAVIIVSVVSSIISVPVAYSLIWYERFGSDNRRTLINKLLSAICWYGMVFCSSSQLAYAFRFYYGPLPQVICFWLVLARKIIITNSIVLVNVMTLTRYIFIFWLKNPAAFNDEFWFVYVNLWSIGFSTIYQFLRGIVPGNQLLEYNICSGDDPSSLLSTPAFLRGYIEIFSVILHIYVYIRIIVYKRKQRMTIGPNVQAQSIKNEVLQEFEKQSLTNLTFNLTGIVQLVLGTLSMVLLKIRSCHDIQDSLTSTLLIYSYLIFPNAIMGYVFAFCFIKNRFVLKNLVREIKAAINNG